MWRITGALLLTARKALSGFTLAILLGVSGTTPAVADEDDARAILKSMSDYVASQDRLSFGYDASLEVITKDDQRLALVSSGTVTLERPGNMHTTRSGGFLDTETFFDGETVTLLGKTANLFIQMDAPGTIDDLIDMMETELGRSPPAARLLLSDAYDRLMQNVTDVKDLGSGVVNGIECDFLAFRTDLVDWQIWIAQGDKPYPCRYVLTSRDIPGGPQYSIQVNDWKTGEDVEPAGFTFENTTNATQIDPSDLASKMSELPSNFTMGE